MAYSKQTWANGEAGGTPVSAARLTHMEDGIEAADSAATAAYVKPGTGIPATDLASAVQASLGLADTATQPGDLADVATSGAYGDLSGAPSIPSTAADVGAVPTSRTLTAGTGLTGGGDLTANRTLAVTYGTASGTAAQGNDSRITGAAQKASNLSDLANAGTARTNLGLGTAATQASGAFATAAQGTKADGAATNTLGGSEAVAAGSATTGTVTLNCSAASVFTVSPSGNITLAPSNVPSSGTSCTITVIISQSSTVRTVTMPSGSIWLGTAPVQVASKKCVITMLTTDGGSSWICSAGVQA